MKRYEQNETIRLEIDSLALASRASHLPVGKCKLRRGRVVHNDKSLQTMLSKLSIAENRRVVLESRKLNTRKVDRAIQHIDRKVSKVCQNSQTGLRETDYAAISCDYRVKLDYIHVSTEKLYCVSCKHALSKRENKGAAKVLVPVCPKCSGALRKINVLGPKV